MSAARADIVSFPTQPAGQRGRVPRSHVVDLDVRFGFRFGIIPLVAFVSCAMAGLLCGQELPASETDKPDEFIPEAPSIWTQTLNARTSVGYNDNLLLDAPRSEKSLALAGGLDASLVRLPLDGRQLLFYVSADYTYYPKGAQVDHEAFVFGLSQLKLDLGPNWEAGVDLQYLFYDQVIDTSVTENTLSATPVRAHGVSARPSLRRLWPRGFWVEGLVGASRQWLAAPFDDYWEGGPKLEFGLEYGSRSSISTSYEWKPRAYDTREEVSLSGTNLPGTELKFQVHAVELAWRHNWDQERRWRTITKLEMLVNRDSGPGYFDYQRYQVSQQIRYVTKQWDAKAQARLAHYDFSNQRASSTDFDQRVKNVLGFSIRGERRLSKYVRLFADYSYEESLSNRGTDEYRVNKVAGGVDCGF